MGRVRSKNSGCRNGGAPAVRHRHCSQRSRQPRAPRTNGTQYDPFRPAAWPVAVDVFPDRRELIDSAPVMVFRSDSDDNQNECHTEPRSASDPLFPRSPLKRAHLRVLVGVGEVPGVGFQHPGTRPCSWTIGVHYHRGSSATVRQPPVLK